MLALAAARIATDPALLRESLLAVIAVCGTVLADDGPPGRGTIVRPGVVGAERAQCVGTRRSPLSLRVTHARQTGVSERTLRRKVARFVARGMRSHSPRRGEGGALPQFRSLLQLGGRMIFHRQ